ncbi:LOW QUALITY PROTEIN: sodium-dependent proline transporter-like [Colius striatus]|uniref:LOW QUALITY PROTEIN: sodium-dependent proline transporter-like n=1 Tax=Colius striatus TaxID=57412 RepID=UPI002B1D4532|nr:LOW QUALITY PROTEIN: sodium-dependent proline transporter-like [Colius striatus]
MAATVTATPRDCASSGTARRVSRLSDGPWPTRDATPLAQKPVGARWPVRQPAHGTRDNAPPAPRCCGRSLGLSRLRGARDVPGSSRCRRSAPGRSCARRWERSLPVAAPPGPCRLGSAGMPRPRRPSPPPAPAPAAPTEPTLNIFQTEGLTNAPPSQLWPGPQPQPEVLSPSLPRQSWALRSELVLRCLSSCAGLGHVWRFPYLCYRHGGGVFLIPYFIMLLVMGLPLFLMELSLGQFGAAGPIAVWKCFPLLRGIGVAMLTVCCLVSLYYNLIVAWALFYLGSSFQSPLPWSCDAPWNKDLCQDPAGNISQVSASASELFWTEQVLGVTHSSGLGDPGRVQWPLALCLLAAWTLVFLCVLKGIHSSGKVMYVTATFPYLLLLILLIRGATLDGSLPGVRFFLTSDWGRLQSAQVWSDAASQVFFSLGIGFGGLLSTASCKKFDNNVVRATLLMAVGSSCSSLLAGFATFSALGHVAHSKRVPVGSVVRSGPGLVFVAYPAALALLPGSPFWSILFFLMLLVLGVDTMFRNVEGITTAILDEFPALCGWRKKTALLGALCICFYLLGLLLVTQGGIFWVTLIDTYSTGFGLVIVALFMCLGIAFCYGLNRLCQDVVATLCGCPRWCSRVLGGFRLCWAFLTPCLLLFTLIYTCLEMWREPLSYGTYRYPAWGTSLGICMGLLVCLHVPLGAALALSRQSGTLRDRFQKATQPQGSWGAPSAQDVAAAIDVPFTISLAGSDCGAEPCGHSRI